MGKVREKQKMSVKEVCDQRPAMHVRFLTRPKYLRPSACQSCPHMNVCVCELVRRGKQGKN